MRVITGGQTGADQGALRAARALGLETGGWAPAGWMTEAGPAPWLADFGLRQSTGGYFARTRQNVRLASAILLIAGRPSTGSDLTARLARDLGRPLQIVSPAHLPDLSALDPALLGADVLMVAGHRESVWPGLAALAERELSRLLG